MELYQRAIEVIDANLIYCLPTIILILMFVRLLFKNRFETKKALHFICWIIITYTIVSSVIYFTTIVLKPEEFNFVKRINGPYALTFWMMFLSATILPLTLLSKKMASKYWYVLFVAFAMKIANYFECFVIISTSFHRDYLPNSISSGFLADSTLLIALLVLQSIIITILILGIFEWIKKK